MAAVNIEFSKVVHVSLKHFSGWPTIAKWQASKTRKEGRKLKRAITKRTKTKRYIHKKWEEIESESARLERKKKRD